ncbi:hypothetical protein ACR30L_09925 [Psychromonas sp. PT13]|uniref:hypothetical protein n=1 Tax=Psychromonas sp. PT13 TaxID=3439547 RepID=UPI003EC0BCBD
MKHTLIGIVILFSTAGCAVVTSSEVELVNNGIYKVSTHMKGIKVNGQENSGLTSRAAVSKAKDFCSARGNRSLKVIDQSVQIGGMAPAYLYFRCIK